MSRNLVRPIFLSLFFGLALSLSPIAQAKEGDSAFSVSPDSAFIGLTTAIMEARSSIDVNVYMFTSKSIARVLATKAEQGVKIRVLVEGEPHGGSVFPAVKQTLDDLQLIFLKSPLSTQLFVMTGQGNKTKRRYVFNHAKYVIVDQKKIFVSSDNFTGSAFPDPSRTLYEGGTRGWQVYMENKRVAAELTKLFETDINGQSDVVPYAKAGLVVSDPSNGPLPNRPHRTAKTFGIELGKSTKASLCASPMSESCVLKFIRSAKKELLVEYLSLPLYWKPYGAEKGPINPIVAEILAAAERGVRVKVLVNDEKTFEEKEGPQDKELDNSFLVQWLKKEASRRGLPLEAALYSAANTQTSYVHNKGLLADGLRVFVSSINGTQNSVENNREIGVAFDSVEGARYFQEVFQFDWENRQK